MFRWLQALVRRELVSEVPPEMGLCLDCGRILCSELDFAQFRGPISDGGPKDRRFRDEAHRLFDR